LVAHSLWERGAVGSNPATPTNVSRGASGLAAHLTAVGDSNAGHAPSPSSSTGCTTCGQHSALQPPPVSRGSTSRYACFPCKSQSAGAQPPSSCADPGEHLCSPVWSPSVSRRSGLRRWPTSSWTPSTACRSIDSSPPTRRASTRQQRSSPNSSTTTHPHSRGRNPGDEAAEEEPSATDFSSWSVGQVRLRLSRISELPR
jgi:hypothetical protein